MQIEAPAKINLALHVVGQRDDGYHLLDTLVAFAKTGDRLTLEPSDIFSLEMTGPESAQLSTGDDNLVLRAAKGLAQIAGVEATGAKMNLEKNLPIASGIGGGSADAAAAIKGLCNLWQLDHTADEVTKLARSLGADVPMCLFERPVHASGIGDELRPVALPAFPIVLLNPRVPVSTPDVFKHLTSKDNAPMSSFPENGDWIEFLRRQRNDLETPAIETAPVISDALSALHKSDGCQLARMSGSGATCLGLYESNSQAALAAEQVLHEHPGWWVVATETYGSKPLTGTN